VSASDKAAFRFRGDRAPPPASGDARRFYDARFKAYSVVVLPGRHYVTRDPEEMVVTLLGSCVAACIRDPVAGIGGLNHFLLPESESGRWGETDATLRYGNHAMETLINDIIRSGGDRRRLEVKVFGGANMIESATQRPIGSLNAAFVEHYLRNEGFTIAAKHLEGTLPRRIHYFPITGKVQMLLLRRTPDKDLFSKELEHRRKLQTEAPAGSVELFD
jgi:chemotaxis protein CheD